MEGRGRVRTGLAITEDVVTSSQRIQQRNSTSGFLLATPCPGTALCREISSCTRSTSRLRGICTQKWCTLSTTPAMAAQQQHQQSWAATSSSFQSQVCTELECPETQSAFKETRRASQREGRAKLQELNTRTHSQTTILLLHSGQSRLSNVQSL